MLVSPDEIPCKPSVELGQGWKVEDIVGTECMARSNRRVASARVSRADNSWRPTVRFTQI